MIRRQDFALVQSCGPMIPLLLLSCWDFSVEARAIILDFEMLVLKLKN